MTIIIILFNFIWHHVDFNYTCIGIAGLIWNVKLHEVHAEKIHNTNYDWKLCVYVMSNISNRKVCNKPY